MERLGLREIGRRLEEVGRRWEMTRLRWRLMYGFKPGEAAATVVTVGASLGLALLISASCDGKINRSSKLPPSTPDPKAGLKYDLEATAGCQGEKSTLRVVSQYLPQNGSLKTGILGMGVAGAKGTYILGEVGADDSSGQGLFDRVYIGEALPDGRYTDSEKIVPFRLDGGRRYDVALWQGTVNITPGGKREVRLDRKELKKTLVQMPVCSH